MTPPCTPTPMTAPTPFVMCADDYGMTPEVSAGILELVRQRSLSATSVMSLSPHWADWAAPLQEVKADIDVGLHLDWTSADAVQRGFGGSLPKVMALSTLRLLQPASVERAIEEQLDLFEHHFQAPPDHVDGHQHVHQFPVIRDMLMRVLSRRYKGAQRPWIRISRVVEHPPSLKGHVISAMGAQALQTLASRLGFAHSQCLTGIYDFHGDAHLYRQRLRGWLEHLPPGAVLMCHPAQGLSDDAPFAAARVWEQEVLLGQPFQQLLSSTNTTLAQGRAIFGHPAAGTDKTP